MAKVKGKEKLCSCELRFFKSTQGQGGYSLFSRYPALEILVQKNVDAPYQHFLAQPEMDQDTITWFTHPYRQNPRRLIELPEQERARYDRVKEETVAHYRRVIQTLQDQGKTVEADMLSGATKFIDDRFLYAFDGKVVLGIWGMQQKENLREALGVIMKDMFVRKPQEEEPSLPEPEPLPEPPPYEEPYDPSYAIRFEPGEHGTLTGNAFLEKRGHERILGDEIPTVQPREGYEFMGWDRDPLDFYPSGDSAFTATYREVAPPARLPWWKRLWLFLTSAGCLRWLLWLLLILLLLWLLCWLFKGCGDEIVATPIPDPVAEKPWVAEDPRVGSEGGIYHPGNPYEAVPTPEPYIDVLPPQQGVLPPVDSSMIRRVPGQPVILAHRLNVLLKNEGRSIMDLAREFKAKYPDERYQVVYYDDVVKRMQIEVPESERVRIKQDLPGQMAPGFDVFVFDEALFQANYWPNDPDLKDAGKAWHLKAIQAAEAWDISRNATHTGRVTLAIIDDGFHLRHPELRDKVVMPYNVWRHSKDVTPQESGHGTHVAGTALATADNGIGISGVAPQSAFMPVQVGDAQGFITTTSVLDGVLYALYQGADVVNVSLGMAFTGRLPDNVQQDFLNNRFKEEERLWNEVMHIADRHRAVVVIASGNSNMLAGVDPMQRPKNFVIVSAVDKTSSPLQKADFSNFGAYSTVSAPGVDIYSTMGDDGYQALEGTSMASPIVAGAVALMKGIQPDLSAEHVICVLQSTGAPAEGGVGPLLQLKNALEKVRSGDFDDCDFRPAVPSTGDVQVLLSWNNLNDLDLLCTDPNGETVWFRNRQVSSGGLLEIDMNVNYPDSETPIENIFWPVGQAPAGTYSVFLGYYQRHTEVDATPYTVLVKYGDKTEEFSGIISQDQGSIPICTFTLGAGSGAAPRPGSSAPVVVPAPGNTLPPDRRRQLQDQRGRLQREIDQIDRELGGPGRRN